MEKARKQQDKLRQHQESEEKNEEMEKKQSQAQEKLNQALQGVAQELQKNKSGLSKATGDAVKETQQTKDNLKSLIGGTKPGSGDAELKKTPLRDQIALAEKMSTNDKLKEITDWAGRFKQIARQKQRSKHDESVERSGVTIGNQIDRLMPMELAQYASSVTKTDFLRRFAEGQTMQYEQKGKETLGKGPIILCLDQSGSMTEIDAQSKAFSLAMMTVARKQKRDFALILFSNKIKTFEYKKGKLTSNDMVNLATTFLNGGTFFQPPLEKALQIIEKSNFKKADVVFTTDGESNLKTNFIEKFNRLKQEKQFSVLSILLGSEKESTVSTFSDKIVKAIDFADKESQTAFEI